MVAKPQTLKCRALQTLGVSKLWLIDSQDLPNHKCLHILNPKPRDSSHLGTTKEKLQRLQSKLQSKGPLKLQDFLKPGSLNSLSNLGNPKFKGFWISKCVTF